MTTINPEVDDLRPVNDIVQARTGKRNNPVTTWRWRLKGVNGAKLPMVRVSGVWCTTAAAFAEFIRAQTANCSPAPMDSDAPAERSAATAKKLVETDRPRKKLEIGSEMTAAEPRRAVRFAAGR